MAIVCNVSSSIATSSLRTFALANLQLDNFARDLARVMTIILLPHLSVERINLKPKPDLFPNLIAGSEKGGKDE